MRVHLGLLFGVAVLAAAGSLPMTRPALGATPDLDPMAFKLVWYSFAAYAGLSSLGLVCWRSLAALFGMHGVALVFAVPAGVILLILKVWLLGPSS